MVRGRSIKFDRKHAMNHIEYILKKATQRYLHGYNLHVNIIFMLLWHYHAFTFVRSYLQDEMVFDVRFLGTPDTFHLIKGNLLTLPECYIMRKLSFIFIASLLSVSVSAPAFAGIKDYEDYTSGETGATLGCVIDSWLGIPACDNTNPSKVKINIHPSGVFKPVPTYDRSLHSSHGGY